MLHFTQSRTIVPLALIAAFALTGLQGAAFAKAPMVPTHRTIVLPINGLDLARPDDVATLTTRIHAAARTVCKPQDYRDLGAWADRSDCEKLATSTAFGQRDSLVAQAQDRAVRMAAMPDALPATN